MTIEQAFQELPDGWYQYPRYYDIAFQAETKREVDFIEAVWKKHGRGRLKRLLEPGCGTGRLVAESAKRGIWSAGFDQSAPAIEYLNKRLQRRRLSGVGYQGDLAHFAADPPFDCLHCFCNTFRHLLTDEDIQSHLNSAALALKPGGLYLLGLHLFPIDADPYDSEFWNASRGKARVRTAFTVVHHDFERRREWIRVTLDVEDRSQRFRIRSWMPLRIHPWQDFQQILAATPAFETVAVYDFLYDAEDPIEVDDYTSDAVFVLRRRKAAR